MTVAFTANRGACEGFVLAAVLVVLLVVAAGALLLVEGGATDNALAERTREGLEADYAAQSALQHALAVANASSCGGYSLPAGTLGASSYSATYSPASGSPVTVTASATTAAGIQRTLVRAAAPVFQQPVVTTLSPVADSFIEGENGHHDHNKGDDRTINTNSDSSKIDHGLIAFDLTAVPAGSRVIGAALNLYLESSNGANDVVQARALTRAWVEAQATWNNAENSRTWSAQGGDYVADIAGTLVADTVGWKTMDLTALAQRWVDQPTENHGFLLLTPAASGNNEKKFASKENENPAFHPTLVVSYACECGVVCGGSTGNGPFAHWKLDEGSGGTAADSVGGHDGTLANGPVWIEAGQVDGALSFDGNDDYVEVPHDDALPFTTEFSVALWARTNGAFASQRLLSKEPIGSNGGFWLGLQAGYLFVGVGGGTHTPPSPLSADEWHHVAVTFSDDADRLVVYLDGLVVLDETVTATIAANTAALIIGSNWEGKTFAGPIDDVRVYDRPLPSEEVAELAGVIPGQLAHWPMDEGSGSTAYDAVGNHHGFLAGAAWDTGYENSGIRFSGPSNAVIVPHRNSLTLTDALTVSAWVLSDGFGGYDFVLSKGSGAPSINYYFGALDDEIVFGFQGASAGQFTTSNLDLATGTWHHIAARFDGASDEVVLFHNGVAVYTGASTAELPGNESDLYIGSSEGGSNWNGVLDDVRLFNVALTDPQVAALAAGAGGTSPGGGGGGGGGTSYTETHEPITASVREQWSELNLSAYGVPGDAVAEIAILNDDASNERLGGVRAFGSTLDRRINLHKAESGGRDVVVLHVQTDAQSRIEYYAQRVDDISFVLLGYWTGVEYVERFDRFSAGASSSWRDHELAKYGVGALEVAEIVMVNANTSREREAGVRSTSSKFERRFDLHEAESGGVDAATLMVTADDSDGARIQVAAEADSDIEFYLTGFWRKPPGSYVESAGISFDPTGPSDTWTDWDPASRGVPAGSVVQVALANRQSDRESGLGVRRKGSSDARGLVLHEAEAGGEDLAVFHVTVDDSGIAQWWDENAADAHTFEVMGWWVTN